MPMSRYRRILEDPVSLAREPMVRLNPDFSVAQVALDRRTVVMLYDPVAQAAPDLDPEPEEEALAWVPGEATNP